MHSPQLADPFRPLPPGSPVAGRSSLSYAGMRLGLFIFYLYTAGLFLGILSQVNHFNEVRHEEAMAVHIRALAWHAVHTKHYHACILSQVNHLSRCGQTLS